MRNREQEQETNNNITQLSTSKPIINLNVFGLNLLKIRRQQLAEWIEKY